MPSDLFGSRALRAAVFMGFVLVGCDASTDSSVLEPFASSSAPIVGGTTLATDPLGTPKLYVVPPLDYDWICSATLLSDRWLLTAQHCVTYKRQVTGGTAVDPATVAIGVGIRGQPSVTANGNWKIYLHPTLDVALIHMDTSLHNPAGLPWANPLYLGAASGLVGESVLCQGWGDNAYDGGASVLRYAWIRIAGTMDQGYYFQGLSPLPWHGDSGGACFSHVNGQWAILGVNSLGWDNGCPDGDCQPFTAYAVGVEYFRDWVQGTVGNAISVFADPKHGGASQQMLPGALIAANNTIDSPRLTIGDNTISSLMVPSGWSLRLFQNPGFGGSYWNYSSGAQPTTLSGEADNQASSARVTYGGARVFTGTDLSGSSNTLAGSGQYALQYPYNNAISSLTVPAGWKVTLFDNSDYTGASVSLTEGTYNTIGAGLDNRASSIRVLEPAAVYVDPNYGGAFAKFAPGCYDTGRLGVPNDSISSVYVPFRRAVQLFEHSGFAGQNTIFGSTASQASLGAWDGLTSSLCVFSMPDMRASGVMVAGDTIATVGTLQDRLYSSDGRFMLIMQGDGNLVLYQGSTPLWASNTVGSGGQMAIMWSGGNFGVYSSSNHNPLWTSITGGHPGAWLIVQNDGNLVIYDGSGPIWSSGTCCH